MIETISIRFIDSKGDPLAMLLATIELTPHCKNSYHINVITDSEGRAHLTAAEIESAIDKSQTDFPMDYSGSLNDIQTVTLIVDDLNTLESRVAGISLWDSNRAKIFQDTIQRTSNSRVSPKRLIVKQNELGPHLNLTIEVNGIKTYNPHIPINVIPGDL